MSWHTKVVVAAQRLGTTALSCARVRAHLCAKTSPHKKGYAHKRFQNKTHSKLLF